MTEVSEIITLSRKNLSRNNLVLRKPIGVQSRDKEESKKYTMRIKPYITDQLNFIKRLRENPNSKFYYMIYAVERSSEYFTPYALKLVDYKDVNRIYMTISVNGVSQYTPDDITFTPIELWEKEYIYYLQLMKKKVFSIFRLWKSFYMWRKLISNRKFTEARHYIQENLFISDLILGKALVKFKNLCVVFLNFSLMDISVIEKLSLFDFVELQLTKLEYAKRKLDEFQELILGTVYDACITTLLQAGYTQDNSNIKQKTYGKLGDYNMIKFKMPKNEVMKRSYIERTRKKEKCHRLFCFIQLIDYMLTNMMHGVLLNTYKEFIEVLEAHTAFIPENTLLDNNVIDTILEERRPMSHTIQHPYFTMDLLMSMTTAIVIDPSQNIFYYIIQTLQTMWEENLSGIKSLSCDPFFHFIRSIINHKMRDQLCENSSKILQIIQEDSIICDLKYKLNDILKTNFNAVNRYCQRFNEIKKFYNEDMKFDEDIIRNNKQCDLFRNLCIRYKREIEKTDKIIQYQPLGIFIVQLERFKNAILNALRSKTKIIEFIMSGICKRKVDALLIDTMETINYLEFDLVSDDYVAYIKFIDKAQQKVDLIETQLDYVKELYDIMEEFDIDISTKDMANYQEINMQFTTLRLAIEKQLEKKQKLIIMFDAKDH